MAKQQNDLLRALKQAEPVKGAVKVDLNAIYRAQQQAKTPYLASEAAAIPSEELELKTEELLTPEFSEQIKSKTEAFREQFTEELTGAAAKYREESDAQPAEEMASVPLSELAMISGSILNMTKDVPGETNAFGYDATARLREKERVLDELKKNYGKYGFSFDLTPMGNYVARSSSGNIEVDLYGDGAQAADKLKGFIAKNAKKTQYQNEEFVDLSLKAQETRPAARINPDGTRSTHLFTTMEVDGKHYAVPTLYQKTPNSQSSDPNDWVEYKSPDEAFKEAVRRGELYQFDTKGQAESFAKGSWKNINQGDLMRKQVAEQNGIEYGVMKQNELKRKSLPAELNNLEEAIDILSSNRPGLEPIKTRLAAKMKKEYGVGTADGLEKVLDEKRKEKDSVDDYFYSLVGIRQEADRQLEVERKKAQQQAIALNREVKTIQGNLNQKFYDYFGVPFLNPDGAINPEIKNVKPSDVASARAFNESIDAYTLLAQRQKQAAQVFLKEQTYLGAKYDKEAQDKYVSEWRGLWNNIRNLWNEGEMQNVAMAAQLAEFSGNTEEMRAMYNEELFKMMNDPTISTLTSAGQERVNEAAESGDFGDYVRALGASPTTFVASVANMFLGNMARMFPIIWEQGSVIVPLSTAVGGVIGSFGGPGGGYTGARTGFSAGMKIVNAASGFSLEYTASVLDAIRKKYNTLEKAQEGEWLNDPEVWEEAKDIGVKRGLTIAAVDAITAGILSKIAPSSLASTARRTTQAVGQALAIEPVSEAFGEAAAQFVSGQELNSVEILGEALGAFGMSSNPLTLADVVYQQTRSDYYTNLAKKMANSRSFLNDMDEDLGKVTQWTNNMRTTGQITGVTEQQILENVSVVREARQMMSATAPTNAQRLSQLALGTSSRAESRLADLIAAKRQLDRTPTINQTMQQVVQDEMNYILQNKKVPEQRVDLAPIIGLTPKYYINGKASLREDVAALLDPAKGADDQLKDLNISIEGDEELLDKYVTRMESIFDKEDYEDGKVMLAAEDINEIPAEFRPEAVFNEETGRHEVTVPADKVENKDIANIAVRPKSQLEAATTAMKEGKPVYAKDTKSGNVYLLEDQAKIDDAYSRGMSLLLGGPSTRGVQTPLPLPKIKADKIKAVKDSLKSMKADIGTMNSFGAGMGKSVWNFAIDSAILAIEAGESVSAAVEKAADYIDSKVTDFKRSDFVAYMTGQLTEKEKEIVRQARSTDLPSGLKVVKGFYSTIERRLLTSTIEKQSATKWLQSGIFGGDEGEFTGARAFLQAKRPDEQVEKKELLDYIKKNRVKISVKKDKVKEHANLTEAEEGEYQEIIIEWDDANFPYSFDFNSHYTDKTIAHIRYVIRKDKDGNNVLFIEEVQSDLAQHIRKERQKQKEDPNYTPNAVSAPYVDNTSAWVKLALKVALQEAVKKNVTKVAWTTGEQQNARYNLSDKISFILYTKTDSGYKIYAADESGNPIIEDYPFQENQLQAAVGDEISKKIINGDGEKQSDGRMLLHGLELESNVRGKAMVAFYGSIDEGKAGTVENMMYALVEEITGKKPEIKTAELTLAPFVGKATAANANVNLEEEIERIEKEIDEAVQGVSPYLKAKYLSEAKEILTGKEMIIAHDKYLDGIEGAFKKYFKAGTDIEAMADAVNEIQMLDRSKRFAILAIKQIKEERKQAERRANSSTSKQRSVDITPQIVEKVKSGIPAFNDEKLSIEQRAEKIRQKMFAMKAKIDESVRPGVLSFNEQEAIRVLAKKIGWRIGVTDFTFTSDPNERWKGQYDPLTHSVKINFSYVTKDTPFHEILAHPIIYSLKNGSESSRELYDNLVKELQDSPEGIAAYNMVSQLYPELTEDQKIEEALVTLLGQLASESFDKKSKLGMLLEKLWNFVSEYVRELLGKDVIKVGELKPTTTIQDLADIMGYGDNIIALPGAELSYTTPFGETYASIEDVKQDMARAGAAATLEFPAEPSVGKKIKQLIIQFASAEEVWLMDNIRDEITEELKKITSLTYYDSITGKTYNYKLKDEKVWEVTDLETGIVVNDLSVRRYDKNLSDTFSHIGTSDPRLFILNFAKNLQQYCSDERKYVLSKQIVDGWKNKFGVKYDPKEAYDRGYGFYHYLGTGMSKTDVVAVIQNIGRFLELQEKVGGEYALSCLNRLASLPIIPTDAPELSYFKGGIRIALYPAPEDILYAAQGDIMSGSAGSAAGNVSPAKMISPDKMSGRVGVSLLRYPDPEPDYLEAVANSVLASMTENVLGLTLDEQDRMREYNELSIRLKKGRFRIEYDVSSKFINSETRRFIEYINKTYGIKDSNIPEIKPNTLFGIKQGSFVELDQILGKKYEPTLIKITYVNEKNKTFSGIIMNEDGETVYVPTQGGMVYPSIKKGQLFVTDISFDDVNPNAFINYQYSQGQKAPFPNKSKSLLNYFYETENEGINPMQLKKNEKRRLLESMNFIEAVAQANREFPMLLLESSVKFAGFQPNEDTDVRFSRVPENDQTLYGAINDARNEGLTDGEIKRRMQQEGYSSSDINEAMTINIGDKEKLPRAFTMVEGGAFAGYSMYTNVQQKIRRFAKKEVNGEKPSSAKIREFAMQELSKHPLFLSSSDYLQMSLMADLDATLNTTANTAIQAQMKRIREAMRNINKGARELNEIRRQLAILIKSSLPRTMYAKAEVMALLKKVSSANRENIAEIRREVADFVIGVRVRATRAKLLKQLAAETTKKEGGRVKGNFSTAMQERIAKIKGMLPDEKASVEEIQKAIVALNSEYTRLNELVIDEGKDEYAEDLADVEFALKFAATMLMDDIEENKLIALDELYSYMKDFLKTGRAAFKDELKAQSEYYNKLKRQLLKDITGGDYNVNFSDKKAVDKVERALMGESVQKEKQRSFGKVLRSFVDDTIGAMLRRTEDLAGLVDRISNMTGEFFGGVSKKLIVDRVRESRANLNKLNNDAMAYLQANAEQIFGKGWKKIMIQNGKKKFTYIMDPKGYKKVLKTGDKVAIQAFLLQNEAPISQNEMYYLYNQYKDAANHPGFETKFGPEYKEIMAEITSKLDPKVKEWADWQVEEFYPNMYPIYNEVYRRVYRTDLPWNQFYAGRLYRESADGQEAPSLLEKPSEFITAVGGASTKERVRNNKAVKTMDGDKALTSYVRDMNFFASYAESIRDIKKMLNNITIRKAIETRVGKDIYSLLNMMTDRLITDGFGKGKENDILDAGFKTFVYAKLGLNPKIMLAQASSFVGFIPFIGYGSYAKYATRVFSDLRKGKESTAYKTWAEMMENSEYLKARFSTSNIMEIMSTFSDSKRDVVLGGDKGLSIDNYANVMMYFIKQGDKAGVMGSVPNYLFYKEQYINKQKAAKKKVSEQDAIKYALKKIEAQVKSVAQSNDVEDKDFFQTGSTAWRMFGVFQSQPKQYFRLEMYAIRNIYKQLMGLSGSKGTLGQNIRLFVTVHLVAPVLFQYLMLGLPGILTDFDDDDDEELVWAGVLGNLNAIFVIGDIFQKIRDIALSKPWAKDTTSISAFSVIADLSKELWDIFHAKTDETRTEHIVNFSLLLSELSGIPASTLFKLSQNWYKVATGDVDDFGEAMLRLFNYSEYAIKGAPKKQKKAEDFTFEEDFKFEE
jgi:hypothetical protein